MEEEEIKIVLRIKEVGIRMVEILEKLTNWLDFGNDGTDGCCAIVGFEDGEIELSEIEGKTPFPQGVNGIVWSERVGGIRPTKSNTHKI